MERSEHLFYVLVITWAIEVGLAAHYIDRRQYGLALIWSLGSLSLSQAVSARYWTRVDR